MPKKLTCEGIGFACDKVFEAANDQELLDQARQHMLLEHPDEPLDEEHVRAHITDS